MTATDRLSTALADRYRIERRLGEGGMATVYLAEDLKHRRRVALKVLKPELAAVLGAERFVQEIATTASLQHPHILPLFDSGQADGFLYYVMPFIDGETLRDRLNRETQLGIEEAVRITTEVADALDHAHRHGVIHRDIKPENVLLADGRPMVADFGIALAVSAAAGGRMTETGLSLGTPHYMSPEQATADREIGPRSDVYSLGSILYEMLTGEPPHTGGSAQHVIMKIIADTARPVTELRKSVPPNVAAAVARSLEKLPADRWASAKAFSEALSNPTVVTDLPFRATLPAQRVDWRRFAWPAVAATLASLAAWGWLRPDPVPSVSRYRITFPPGEEPFDGNNPGFALAPDGSWLVYDGPAERGSQLWIKRRDQLNASPIPGTATATGNVTAPAVSPDGSWIAFSVGAEILKVPVGGGSPITLFDSASAYRTIAWLDDHTIVFRDRQNRLRRIPDVGGPTEIIWSAPDSQDIRPHLPTALPGARGVLFVRCGGLECSGRMLAVLDLASGAAKELIPDVMQAWYVPTGHLVYARDDGGVFAALFDLDDLALTGPAVPVLDGVQAMQGTAPDLAISRTGTLFMNAAAAGGATGTFEAVWVDRSGNASPVDPDWRFNLGATFNASLSPDGSRVALDVRTDAANDIWIKQLDRGPLSRLTTHPASDDRPEWSRDGGSIAWISSRGAGRVVLRQRADGTRPEEMLLDLPTTPQEITFSRDGAWALVRAGTPPNSEIWGLRLGVDTAPRRLLSSRFNDRALALSPDGKWMAYQSAESGGDEVYVRPFPDLEAGRVIVSIGGGTQPLWSHSGRELFYVNAADELVAARVETSGGFQILERRVLFGMTPYVQQQANSTPFDIRLDDQQFLMVRRANLGDDAGSYILVENWFEELKARVPR
ncbi:MAG TPA: protein kinase [Gemmatimonadaceae bacterium]